MNMLRKLSEKEQTDNTLTLRVGKQRLTLSIEDFITIITAMLNEYKL